jgi:uncharacterized protein DUF3592
MMESAALGRLGGTSASCRCWAEYTTLGLVSTVLAGLILVGVGLALAFVLGRSAMKHGAESEGWPSVTGKVTASEVTGFGPRDDRTYRPSVSYEYSVNGETFTSNRINFDVAGIQSHASLEMQEIVDRYRPGAEVTVFYKPEDPSISCLETGARLGTGAFIGMGCLAIGLLVVVSGTIAGLRSVIARTRA